MDRNQYMQDQLLDFMDEFDTFMRSTLVTEFGPEEWFDRGVLPHIDKRYIERMKQNLSHPLRSLNQEWREDELYGVESLQRIVRGNSLAFGLVFRDVERACAYLREIAEMRNNLAHRRKSYTVDSSEVRRCLDTCATLLKAIKSPRAESFQSAAESMARGAIPWGQKLDATSLPLPDVVVTEFVFRGQELAELHDWMLARDSNRWVVWGDGGVGKSSVAYHFAVQIRDLNPEGYLAVGWVSAKSEQLGEDRGVDEIAADFTDVKSAIRAILNALYPWELHDDPPVEEARERLLRALTDYPSLLVIDDIDTRLEDEKLIEFLTFVLPQRASKLLFTSRVQMPGLRGTHVRGFEGSEFVKFLEGRAILLGLDADKIVREAERIQTVTNGYPLFTEDLLRLAQIEGLDQALQGWSSKKGDAARRYALQRQISRLPDASKQTLIAVSTARFPVSLRELAIVVGRSEDEIDPALRELKRSFLIGSADDSEGIPRFEANANTSKLVRDTFGKEVEFRTITAGFSALVPQVKTLARRKSIAAVIRRAAFEVSQNERENAVNILRGAIDDLGDDPDLIGTLGWVYKSWWPHAKQDEARECFKTAHALGGNKVDTYRHWYELERESENWIFAAHAAEAGLPLVQRRQELLFFAGYARSRLGRRLAQELHMERAMAELSKANSHLKEALTSDGDGSIVLGRIYRGLVLNYEALEDWSNVSKWFGEWSKISPDEYLNSELERIAAVHPSIRTAIKDI